MRELSIFVDESGDFGEYDHHAPYYIISMVLHDQGIDITDDVRKFEQGLSNIGWPNLCVHAGPVIRAEEEFRNVPPEDRIRILRQTMSFIRNLNIQFKSIYVEKKHLNGSIEMVGRLSKLLSRFIRDNQDFFYSYDTVKVYYDNGQVEVTKILSSVFNALLENVEFRKVLPANYRLFQVADLVCTLKLIELKMNDHALSNSELLIFTDERTLKKNYLKPLSHKELQ